MILRQETDFAHECLIGMSVCKTVIRGIKAVYKALL